MSNYETTNDGHRKVAEVLRVYNEERLKPRSDTYGKPDESLRRRVAKRCGIDYHAVHHIVTHKNEFLDTMRAASKVPDYIGKPLAVDPPRDAQGRRADYYLRGRDAR